MSIEMHQSSRFTHITDMGTSSIAIKNVCTQTTGISGPGWDVLGRDVNVVLEKLDANLRGHISPNIEKSTKISQDII